MIEITVFILVVVKFFVFVSEVISIFSKILTWIFGGQKDTFAPQLNYWGAHAPAAPPKSMPISHNGWRYSLIKLAPIHMGGYWAYLSGICEHRGLITNDPIFSFSALKRIFISISSRHFKGIINPGL